MSFVRFVNLRVPAGAAKPGPAIGQALGPLGINMAEFCKQFNEKTEPIYERDVPLQVRLHAMSDRSFTFDVRSPPVTYLVKRVVGLDKGPSTTSYDNPIGYITPEQVYEIAKIKQQDDHMWHHSLEGIARMVIGTCRTLGVRVREAVEDETGEGNDTSK
jgi:large subunit ribosomal protein L11